MKTTSLNVSGESITDIVGLDRIDVFWLDLPPCAGMVTICCFGSAWTAYFGAMGCRSIHKFVENAGTDYLVNKMSVPKATRRDQAYLSKIIDAVKSSLAQRREEALGSVVPLPSATSENSL